MPGLGSIFNPGSSYMGHDLPPEIQDKIRREAQLAFASAMFSQPDLGRALGAGLSGSRGIQNQMLSQFANTSQQRERTEREEAEAAARAEEEKARQQQLQNYRKYLATQAKEAGYNDLAQQAWLAPESYLDNVSTELMKRREPKDPEIRSGSSPILERDEEGNWNTVYTPPTSQEPYFVQGRSPIRMVDRDGNVRQIHPGYNSPDEGQSEGVNPLTSSQFRSQITQEMGRIEDDSLSREDKYKAAVENVFNDFSQTPELIPEAYRDAFDSFIVQSSFQDESTQQRSEEVSQIQQIIPPEIQGDERRALIAYAMNLPAEQRAQEILRLATEGFSIDPRTGKIKEKTGFMERLFD